MLHRHCILVQGTHAQRRKWVSRAQLVKPRPRIYEVPSHHGCGLRRIGPGQDQGRAGPQVGDSHDGESSGQPAFTPIVLFVCSGVTLHGFLIFPISPDHAIGNLDQGRRQRTRRVGNLGSVVIRKVFASTIQQQQGELTHPVGEICGIGDGAQFIHILREDVNLIQKQRRQGCNGHDDKIPVFYMANLVCQDGIGLLRRQHLQQAGRNDHSGITRHVTK